MIYLGCGYCQHWRGGTCSAFPERVPLQIVSGDIIHDRVLRGQTGDAAFLPVSGAEVTFRFENERRYPDRDLLDPKDYKLLGYFGDKWLILVGFEDSSRTEALTVKLEEPFPGEYPAYLTSLSSLLRMSPEDVEFLDQDEFYAESSAS